MHLCKYSVNLNRVQIFEFYSDSQSKRIYVLQASITFVIQLLILAIYIANLVLYCESEDQGSRVFLSVGM